VRIEFDLTDDEDKFEYECCLKATKMHLVLSEIREDIFRPARKHGYEKEVQIIIDELDKDNEQSCEDLIGSLEDKFNALLTRYSLEDF